MNRNTSIQRSLVYGISIAALSYSFWSMTCECEPAHPRLSDVTFHAASVMPLVWKLTPSPQLYALLSREAGGEDIGTYDDWGGSRDKGDQHPLVTAAREFTEEAITRKTLNMECRDIIDYIDVKNGRTFFVVVQKGIGRAHVGGSGSTMVTYITLFEPEKIQQLLDKFYGARESIHAWKHKEKDVLALVSWDNLAMAIGKSSHAKDITTTASTIDPKTNTEQTETIILRPALVAKLRSFFKGRPHTVGKSRKILFYKPYQHEPCE